MPQLPKTSAMNKLLGQVSGTFECCLEHPESWKQECPHREMFSAAALPRKKLENEKVQNRA